MSHDTHVKYKTEVLKNQLDNKYRLTHGFRGGMGYTRGWLIIPPEGGIINRRGYNYSLLHSTSSFTNRIALFEGINVGY